MDETRGVVVGYDGSDYSMQALDWAVDEAVFRKLPLTICHTWQWPYDEGDQTARESLRRAAEHVLWHGADCARAGSPGLDVRPDLYEGSATERLEALSADAELLVVGSRGLGAVAQAAVGSVATHVVAHACCPVIVVRGRGPLPRSPQPGPIVAGVADDDLADAVLGFAFAEAAMRGHQPIPVLLILNLRRRRWRRRGRPSPPVVSGRGPQALQAVDELRSGCLRMALARPPAVRQIVVGGFRRSRIHYVCRTYRGKWARAYL